MDVLDFDLGVEDNGVDIVASSGKTLVIRKCNGSLQYWEAARECKQRRACDRKSLYEYDDSKLCQQS